MSPVLNLWFGRYIALGGTETVISVLPATPTTTELYVVPIPTEFGASNVCLCPKSIFLFSNLVSNSNVKSVGVLLTATPLLCAVAAVLLCDLVTLYLLLTVSTLVINICSLPIVITSPLLNLRVIVGSDIWIDVERPVTVVAAIPAERVEETVLTPTVLNPSIFL